MFVAGTLWDSEVRSVGSPIERLIELHSSVYRSLMRYQGRLNGRMMCWNPPLSTWGIVRHPGTGEVDV